MAKWQVVQSEKTQDVVKEAFWLAWQACGKTAGMGFLQDRPCATKEDVWSNVYNQADYAMSTNRPGEVYGDYVFGRMMKLGIQYNHDTIVVRDSVPRLDYQAWCRYYATYDTLITTAAENVGADLVVLP